ncbi:ABC transporter substrate-binding protein [Aquitalea sp. USM4]|uniref:substrate-binding periplasmic protein n=1 Tax=Aquitalea sp. USM4 TaxID=1590041 RepID=UPI001A954615|nr:transporter substrate-binding domain-containing protein [Aquitalea sp. USM4]
MIAACAAPWWWMARRLVWLVPCAAVLCGLPGPVYAQRSAPLPSGQMAIVLSADDWPPYIGANLPNNGILSRVVSAAFARSGVTVRYRFMPNNRSLQSARNGMVDGSLGWAPSPDRLQDLLYTKPVLSARMVFFQQRSHVVSWKQLAELSGMRIGITIGNYYSDEFDRLVRQGVLHTDGAADDLSNFRKLLARRIDLFPIEEEVGLFLLGRHFSRAETAKLQHSQPFWLAPLHVVIWKKHPHGAELIDRFNRGLLAIQRSGELARLVQETRQACLRSAQPAAEPE